MSPLPWIFRAVVSSAFLALTACGPRGLLSFELGHDIAEQRVEGSPVGGLLGNVVEVPIPLDVDLAAETASRDTGPAQHVYLTELRFDITTTEEPAGDADDFDFLDAVEIYVESARSGSSLPRRRLAALEAVPRGARRLELRPDGLDLIEYVREGARLTSSGSGRLPPDDVSFSGHLTLAVEVLP